MWKKATLPLLLLLLLTALLLAQLAATESTQPQANAKDISTSSTTVRFVETAVDINDKDDDADDADEATVETYTVGQAEVTKTATTKLIKTTPTNDEDEENVPHEGSGGGDGCDGVGSAEASEVLLLKLRGRDRLASIMVREVTQLIDFALAQQRSVVNQFLQDDTIEMVKCAAMAEVKKSCTSFIAGVSEVLKMDKGEDFKTQLAHFGVKTLMARNFEAFVEQHNTTRLKQPTAENVIINNALKKAGVSQIEVELQQRFMQFLKFFNATVVGYIDQLTPAHRERDAKIVEWYQKFKAATDISSQVIILSKFLPLYKKDCSVEMESN